MSEERERKIEAEEAAQEDAFEMSENWAHENIEALDDFIESQGVYLRQ